MSLNMIMYIKSLPEHDVADTLSLNEARRVLQEMSKPSLELELRIEKAIDFTRNLQAQLEDQSNDVNKLLNRVYATSSVSLKYNGEKVTRKIIDTNIERSLSEKIVTSDHLAALLEQYDATIVKLRDEQNKMKTMRGKFVSFVQKNALIVFNDELASYVDLWLVNMAENANKPLVTSLTQSREEYLQQKMWYEEDFSNGTEADSHTTTHLMDQLKNELAQLDIQGHSLKNICEELASIKTNFVQRTEEKITFDNE